MSCEGCYSEEFRAACCLSPLVCPEPRSSRNAPRETESGPKTSPLARFAAETVALGRSRATWRMRVLWNAPKETESAPNPSPLGCFAAETVALGAFRGTCGAGVPQIEPRASAPIPGLAFLGVPRGTWNPPPRHSLAFEFTR